MGCKKAAICVRIFYMRVFLHVTFYRPIYGKKGKIKLKECILSGREGAGGNGFIEECVHVRDACYEFGSSY